MCVFSFDFQEERCPSHTRKTQFFRRLYGYTQRLKRHRKDGQIVSASYHYPGVLDQLPHVKLGKSVFGVIPGSIDPVLDLFHAFPEVMFHKFIGWIPVASCPPGIDAKVMMASSLVERFGFLSLLVMAHKQGGLLSRSFLHEVGLEDTYINAAVNFLLDRGLIQVSHERLKLTPQGYTLAKLLSDDVS